ncbi:hypothetical protein, partial [Xanthomonas campestris]
PTTQYPSTPGFISNHWYGRWGQVTGPTLDYVHLNGAVLMMKAAGVIFATALFEHFRNFLRTHLACFKQVLVINVCSTVVGVVA